MKDLKYLFGYVPMVLIFIGLTQQGAWSWATLIFTFGLVPALEFLLKGNEANLTEQEETSRLSNRFFDVLLYLNIPLLYGALFLYFYVLSTANLMTHEVIGLTFGVGIIGGTAGINVGHELGHRSTNYEQIFSQILLLPTMYMHFFIEHNLGHHKWIATKEDPASAWYGQSIYHFYWRSVTKGYFSAWTIENKRLEKLGKAPFSLSNRMIWYQILQISYLTLVALVFSPTIMVFAIIVAIISFLLLETVNYIEHYGLRREKLENGRYETVKPHHSWNSNHTLGRVMLYELTRHSDHHFKANRKYQVLRHFDESPQMPYGYPGSMLLALIPPLWFWRMNKEVKQYNSSLTN